jgi:D-Tyr-tRNAtyr deacylase
MNEQIKEQLDLIDSIEIKFRKKISLNESETASILGVSASTLAARRKEGMGPEYRKVGSRYLYPKTKIAEFLLQTIKTV